MNEKVSAALTMLEKARQSALEVVIAERQYRVAVVLDQDGPVQKAIERGRKLLAGKVKKAKK